MTTKTKLPEKKYKKKRKTRSDKGKKRGSRNGIEIKSKATKLVSKYLFDEVVISKNWYMQVKDNLVSRSDKDKYVIEFMLDGTRYTYRNYFKDASMAYTIGEMYLNHRYNNKGVYS